jgi:hypothetical protein
MKSIILLLISTYYLSCDSYINGNEEKHFCGKFEIEDLISDSTCSTWFMQEYKNYDFKADTSLKTKLNEYKVEIYLGTWCGDSKQWVPRFIKVWNELGLERSNLQMCALYDKTIYGKSKKGPKGEEIGKSIFRVPTFIFYKNGIEMARIIESPHKDLISDLTKIANNKILKTNYPASSYLIKLFENESLENIKKHRNKIVNQIKNKLSDYSELNSTATYFIDIDRLDIAMEIFEINNNIFKNSIELLEDFAEKLEYYSNSKEIIDVYFRILEIDSNNKNARERLDYLSK